MRRYEPFLRALVCALLAVWMFAPGQAFFHASFYGWLCSAVASSLLLVASVRGRHGPTTILAAGLAFVTASSPQALPLATGMLFAPALWILWRSGENPEDPRAWRVLAGGLMIWAGWSLYGWYRWRLCANEEIEGYLTYINGETWPGRSSWAKNDFPMLHANYTSGMGVLMLPIIAGVMWTDRKNRPLRTLWMFGIVMALAIVASGGSRVGIPALTGTALVMLLFTKTPEWFRRRRTMVISCVVAAGILGALAMPTTRRWITDPTSKTYSDLIRRDYAEAAVNLFESYPLSGIGAGRIPQNYGAFQGLSADHPSCYQVHSTPFQWLAEYGICGLLLYFAWISAAAWTLITSVRRETSPIRKAAAAAAFAYALYSLFDYELNLIPFAGVTVVALATAVPVRNDARKLRIAGLLAPGLALLAAGLIVWRTTTEFAGRLHARRAAAALNAGKLPEAVGELRAAMLADPENPVYPVQFAAYGAVLPFDTPEAAKRFGLATGTAWRHALALSPNAPFLDAEYAATLLYSDPAIARHICLRALEKCPKSETTWLALAQAYQHANRPDDAATAIAMAAMISPSYAYSPRIMRNEFGGGKNAALSRYRELADDYCRSESDDVRGTATLRRNLADLEAWASCDGDAKRFLETHPTQCDTPGWLRLRERLLEAAKLPDDFTRMVKERGALGAMAYAYLKMDVKLGGSNILWKQYVAGKMPESGGRVLRSTADIPVFGLYFGNADLARVPSSLRWEDDMFAITFVYEAKQDLPHLRAAFFARQRAALVAKDSRPDTGNR